jgi:hypothetical protein
MQATNEGPGWTSQFRALIGSIDAELDDVTDNSDLLDPNNYYASQVFGAERRKAGSNGITWPSVRYAGGRCIAIFWPDVIPIPRQGAHYAYHWNGTNVDYIKNMANGQITRVSSE